MQAVQVLHGILGKSCSWMHATRRDALAAVVGAGLCGGRLTVTDLGRCMASDAKEKHCIKRACRLLSNRHLHGERMAMYGRLARLAVGSTTRPVVIVDWSDMDGSKRHFLIRASTPVGGRAVTLYEEVHSKTTSGKPLTHRRFLRRVSTLLPPGCRPVVVTDAGFQRPWFKEVTRLGWDYVGRIRGRNLVKFDEATGWLPCKSLYGFATTTPRRLDKVTLTRSNPVECTLVLYKGKAKGRVKRTRFGLSARNRHSLKNAARKREPWLLATSLPVCSTLAKRVVGLYATRMQIEESFRDLKSSRFGLSFEYCRSKDLERLQILLLIGALCTLVLWLQGKAVELTAQHRQYQANTVKDKAVLSTIFIGMRAFDDHRIRLEKKDLIDAMRCLQQTVANYGYHR